MHFACCAMCGMRNPNCGGFEADALAWCNIEKLELYARMLCSASIISCGRLATSCCHGTTIAATRQAAAHTRLADSSSTAHVHAVTM